jgi:hypothetical protein
MFALCYWATLLFYLKEGPISVFAGCRTMTLYACLAVEQMWKRSEISNGTWLTMRTFCCWWVPASMTDQDSSMKEMVKWCLPWWSRTLSEKAPPATCAGCVIATRTPRVVVVGVWSAFGGLEGMLIQVDRPGPPFESTDHAQLLTNTYIQRQR